MTHEAFPVLFDTKSEAAMTYGAYSLPTSFFINAEGQVIAQAVGAIDAATLQRGIDMIANWLYWIIDDKTKARCCTHRATICTQALISAPKCTQCKTKALMQNGKCTWKFAVLQPSPVIFFFAPESFWKTVYEGCTHFPLWVHNKTIARLSFWQ